VARRPGRSLGATWRRSLVVAVPDRRRHARSGSRTIGAVGRGTTITLKVGSRTSSRLEFEVKHLWNGGWAGRNQSAVRRHVEEMERLGVPAPSTTPIFFPLASTLATTADRVEVLGGETSGEVEYALLIDDGRVLVTVASDHTDRGFERYGIQASKQLYPDVLAPEAWPLEACRGHWDQLVLRCWTTASGHRRLYQEASLAELLGADTWLDLLTRERVPGDGLVFLSGTPASLGGVVFGDLYEIELEDPVLGRAIRHQYSVDVLGPGHQ
jgi:Protein of unknown function (DUF2848)